MIEVIAFDADDTLWHNEPHYLEAKTRFGQLLSGHAGEQAERRLDDVEVQNVHVYGYGIRSFTLSMIEAAVNYTECRVTGREIEGILGLGRHMLTAGVELFDHAQETLARLSAVFELMLITKGDHFEQDRKVECSGLAPYFRHVEIVGEKTAASYREVLERCGVDAKRFLMVGNSLKSDVLPVLEIGGSAVYIPYTHTWAHERVADAAIPETGYFELEHLGQLPALVDKLMLE